MKLRVRQPRQVKDLQYILEDINVEDIVTNAYSILAIDGSTTNTGMTILREQDGAFMYTLSASREKKIETPVQYKVRLKRQVADILRKNKNIKTIFYEQPIIGNITAVKNLFMLRTFIEEMIFENEPEFDYINFIEVPNTLWKRIILTPTPLPQGTDKQKEAVKSRILSWLPFLEEVTQDEIDSYGMGYAAVLQTKNGGKFEDLKEKKKPSRFMYKAEFVGADDLDSFIESFGDLYEGPKELLDKEIGFIELGKRANFDKAVYSGIGDEDKIVIIQFDANSHGNIILKHNIGALAAQYDYIFATVYRKNRK